jgi:transposase
MKERGLAPGGSPEQPSEVPHPFTTKEAHVNAEYNGRQVVGVDLHRRRSVIVQMTPEGQRLGTTGIVNDSVTLADEVAKWGEDPEVVLEATYGWYWAADVLAEQGARVRLAHPLGIKGFAYRRVKNDELDAADLADLLRMGRLPEAWIAPPATRALRELVRHRAKLVALRSGLKAQVPAVLAKPGVHIPVSDLFGVGGRQLLAGAGLDPEYRARVDSLVRLVDAYDSEVTRFDKIVRNRLADHRGWRVIQTIGGVGPVLAAVLVAEIGEVRRFANPAKLACWAGLTPRHRESDTTVHRGPITKQGSKLVRWAAIEATQRTPTGTKLATDRARIIANRGRNIGVVAAARKLLTHVYYGLRDGHIRALAKAAA